MDAFTIRERAWFHFELGNFDTANLLFARAFEVEHAAAVTASTEVVL